MPIPLGVLAVAGAGAAGAAGAYEWLETQILNSDASSITFSNLNSTYGSTYQHLQVRATARTNHTSENLDTLAMRINNATAGYRWHTLQGTGSGSPTSVAQLNNTFIRTGYAPAQNNTANSFAGIVVDILDPFETIKNKTIRSLSGMVDSSWTLINLNSASWESTNAVNTLTFLPQQGSNLKQGTRISLYGLRSA